MMLCNMAKVRRLLAKSTAAQDGGLGYDNPCEPATGPMARAKASNQEWGEGAGAGKAGVTGMPTVYRVGHVRPDAKTWPTRRHSHPDYHEFIIVLSGAIQVRIKGERYHGEQGHVMFYPRDAAHEEYSVGAGPLETIFIGWHAEGIDCASWPMVAHDKRDRIQTLARWMIELSSQAEPDMATIQGLMLGIIAEFTVRETHEEIQAVERVRQHMQENLAGCVRLEDLAKVAHISRTHFVRVFTRATGTTPMKYLSRLRVDQARNLILTTKLPMKQIARSVGFADEFQLSRVFKRVTGTVPSSYR
jgi:AraC family transcriptional regulator, transcriptional activator for feuABC-ybbA operon